MGHVPRGSSSRVERIFPTLLIANCSSLSGKFRQSRLISQDYSASSSERGYYSERMRNWYIFTFMTACHMPRRGCWLIKCT